jgi:putative aldouronate transport system substrate-binding protein
MKRIVTKGRTKTLKTTTKGLKRWASILCIIALFGTTACVKQEQGKNANTPDSPKGNKPVELSFYSFNPNGKFYGWDSPIQKALTEKTGVKLKMDFIAGTNQEEKAGVMIAGNEYADLIDGQGVQNKLIDAGAFTPLDDLIDKYGQNIKKVFGTSLDKLRNPKDGKIYFIPSPKNQPEEIVDANQSLLIQYDVLDKLGYPKPETLDDVYKMLKDYMNIVKDVKGQPFIPWGLWADTWGYTITVNNPGLWTNGLTDDGEAYVDPKTNSVQYFETTDKFKNYLKFLNKMYNDKMIDKNAFITKNDQYKSLVASGRVLAMIDGTWDVKDPEAALRQAGMPERAYARFPIVMDKGIKDRSQIYGESYAWGIGVSVNCKDPIAAIKFLDYLATDEGAALLNWGIEGTHYDVVNGKRVMKQEVAAKLNNDQTYRWKEALQAYSLNQLQGAVKLSDGQFASPNNVDDVFKNADDWTKKVMNHYGVKAWGQMFDIKGERPPYGYAWSISLPQDSSGSLAVKKADDTRHIMVPRIIMSKSADEFSKNWDGYQSKLNELNIASWEKEMSDGINARLKLWKIVK